MPSQGIGNITEFGILPIRQILLTSPTLVSLDERILINNLLEGSSFQVTPITRQTDFGTDWILGYNVQVIARTAERPHRYFRNGIAVGGGVFLPQFLQAGTGEVVTLSVTFGNGTFNLQTSPYTEIPMPTRSSTQSFQLAGVSMTTEIVSGAEGFLFGEITIRGTIRNLPTVSPFLSA
jgi:hypothetical protein